MKIFVISMLFVSLAVNGCAVGSNPDPTNVQSLGNNPTGGSMQPAGSMDNSGCGMVSTVVLPNGDTLSVPVFCNENYIDQGDPNPWAASERSINPGIAQEKSTARKEAQR